MIYIGNSDVYKKTLKKNERIKKRKEIKSLLKNGKKIVYPNYKILFYENKIDRDRIAVIITKRCGKANKRNKTKRLYKELFRENKIRIPPYFDILVLPKFGIKKINELDANYFKKWLKKIKKYD